MLAEDKSITYLGRTFRTSIGGHLTDDEYEEIKEWLYRKPNVEAVKIQLQKVKNGNTKINDITRYFFQELIYKTRCAQDAWSVEEAVQYKPIMEYFKGKMDHSPRFYPDTIPLGKRTEDAIRLCGIRCCRKVSNFPMKAIDELLETYLPTGGNYYDFSCGWGVRLMSAMKNNVKYFGTDPNYLLVEKLNELTAMYNDANGTTHSPDIRSIGSEVFIPEWEGKMDFVFSSPPYFNFEIYNVGEQSYKEGMSYDEWLNDWVKPTIKNIYRYLKPGGYFGINVKNIATQGAYCGTIQGQPLEEDINRIIQETGKFEYVKKHYLKNIKRPFGSVHWEENVHGMNPNADERIFMYKKI